MKPFVAALESAIRDGPHVLQRKGMACKECALSTFTAKMYFFESKAK